MGKRLANVKGRTAGDFKPWLTNTEAARVAGEYVKDGCVCCGVRRSPSLGLASAGGEPENINEWVVYTDNETGERKVFCLHCVSLVDPTNSTLLEVTAFLAHLQGCAICGSKKSLDPVTNKQTWHFFQHLDPDAPFIVCLDCKAKSDSGNNGIDC